MARTDDHDMELYGGGVFGDHARNGNGGWEMAQHYPQRSMGTMNKTASPPPLGASIRSTVWWGELEAWMDEEYVRQVCKLMTWEPLAIRVPRPPPDPTSGAIANNLGYCYLTFPSPAHAAQVISHLSSSQTNMPNSQKPFVVNWAANVAVPPPPPPPAPAMPSNTANPGFPIGPQQKEYSIFVGDLAPETSNSDLVAVFRNPVLGLRNDREPKFIRPFTSCKSAKIMLDPVTGVSRGYGFVRFTDESDQQRALIEMHGLYCLSRPMRISPATAKFKPPPGLQSFDMSAPYQFPPSSESMHAQPEAPPKSSVSNPIAAAKTQPPGPSLSITQSSSTISSGSSSSASSFPSTGSSSEELPSLANNLLAQLARQYAANGDPSKIPGIVHPSTSPQPRSANNSSGSSAPPNGMEESWKHHAQARAILGNLIGPNGEQLTSTDPYNTTVFVGGLSPLISEDTLRTFFAPFGDIHYVKVPVGKHCGFVQFVRKIDAEKAIEKMQGFPIGGSRIRLSWGRSQYKAAQAAAQAAQAAALQAQYAAQATAPSVSNIASVNSAPVSTSHPGSQVPSPSSATPSSSGSIQVPGISGGLTHEQALALLSTLGYINDPNTLGHSQHPQQHNGVSPAVLDAFTVNPHAAPRSHPHAHNHPSHSQQLYATNGMPGVSQSPFSPPGTSTGTSFPMMGQGGFQVQSSSNFSPFSPDPNSAYGERDGGRKGTPPYNYGGMSGGKTSPTGGSSPTHGKYGAMFERPSSGGGGGVISRPNSSGMNYNVVMPGRTEEVEDVNGTFASLKLDGGM